MARAVTGGAWCGHVDDYHFGPFARFGFYDWRVVACARALVSEGATVIEVGANVGTETVCLADIVGSSGSVHAVEPFSQNAALLQLNKERYGYGQLRVHRAALSDEPGEVPFLVPPPTMSGVGHLAPAGGLAAEHWLSDVDEPYVRVDVTTLDATAAPLDRLDLVLSDTEGQEVHVLRGGGAALARWRPPLILEAADKWLRRSGSSLAELFAIVTDLDYEVLDMGRFGLEPRTKAGIRSGARASNWLCLPRSMPRRARSRVRAVYHRCAWAPRVRCLNPLSSVGCRPVSLAWPPPA